MDTVYKSILAICVGFLALFFYFDKEWLLYISLGVGAISLMSSQTASWINQGWSYLGKGLGFINSHILLTLVYVFILIPISVFYRFSKNKTLEIHNSKKSLWSERNQVFLKNDLNKTW